MTEQEPEPFVPRNSEAPLDDLRRRLRATRWTDVVDAPDWALGTDVKYLRELATYWSEEFDWAEQESALLAPARFRVDVAGTGIHYVHARATPSAPNVLPLVLSHGWPDSFWRYAKVVPLLCDPGAHGGDPADAFDVVVPDMPGFGYSDRPSGSSPNSIAVADLWAELMALLGYSRFGAAGGDIGGHVSRYLALNHSDRVVAVHRMESGVPAFTGDPAELSPQERQYLTDAQTWAAEEGAYAAMHRTKPQTLAASLNDSPAGLASWMVEKMRAWSDCGGDVERSFTKDELLTNITMYWLTETIGSSMRMYRANAAISEEQRLRYVKTPSGFSLFPGDLLTPPREWLERTANVVRFTEPPRGGHFAPFEEPELYAQELRDFFRPYRQASTPIADVAT
jgi:pimeloyl-ACP methyl ester carboxylesterase